MNVNETTQESDHPVRGQGSDEGGPAAASRASGVRAKATDLLAGRTQAATDLADEAEKLDAARQALADAEREYASKFRAAEKAGWTNKELTVHLGLEDPTRPRRRRSTPKKKTPTNNTTATDEDPGTN